MVLPSFANCFFRAFLISIICGPFYDCAVSVPSLPLHGVVEGLFPVGQLILLCILGCIEVLRCFRYGLLFVVLFACFLLGVSFHYDTVLPLVFSEGVFYLIFCFLEG